MATEGIQIKFRGIKKWRGALKAPAFRSALTQNLKKATMINAKRASAKQRSLIQGSTGLQRSAALTVALKGEDKPLVGDGSLFQAITERDVSKGQSIEVFSGVLRTSDDYNIGKAVHDGITLRVTEAMRGLFFMLWVASERAREGKPLPKLHGRAEELFGMYQHWLPLSPGTKAINIPPRRWIDMAFKDPGLKRECERNWQQAIQQTMRERVRRS